MKSQREYITASSRCPCCDSSDIEGGAVEIDDGGAFQEVDCAACGFAWVDNYKLIGYGFEPTDAPPPSTKHPTPAPPAKARSFDAPLRGKPKVDALEAPSMEQQLSRHLSEEEEAERRAFSDAGGKAYP